MIWIRNIAFLAIAAFFMVNAIRSGDAASIGIAAILAGIAVYVAAGGKVHRKFSQQQPADVSQAFKTQEDRELESFLTRLRKSLSRGKDAQQ